jgi:hypothetical protein
MNKKPYGWRNYSFLDKLKWYTEYEKDKKELYSDKYKIKSIIERMNIPDLHYAKLISHVYPLNTSTNLNVGVPFQHELFKKEQRIDAILEKLTLNNTTIHSQDEILHLLSTHHNIKAISDDFLPEKSYVIKLNLSWNTMIIVKNNRIMKVCYGKHTFPNYQDFFSEWRDICLFHHRKKTPPLFFAEEFLDFNLPVYEIFCIHGQPRLLSLYLESDESFESNYIIEKKPHSEYSFQFLPGKQLMPNTVPIIFSINTKIAQQASQIATHFAKEFEFVRVDFYHHNNKVYFSECTFTPGALKKIKWGYIGKHLSSFWL